MSRAAEIPQETATTRAVDSYAASIIARIQEIGARRFEMKDADVNRLDDVEIALCSIVDALNVRGS